MRTGGCNGRPFFYWRKSINTGDDKHAIFFDFQIIIEKINILNISHYICNNYINNYLNHNNK